MAKKKAQKIQLPEKKYGLAAISFLIIIVGTIIYFHILNSPFAFDDYEILYKNNEIKTHDIFTHFNRSRYIGFISFAINYQIGELDTFGYHLVNLIIHIVNAILVYLLIQKILRIVQDRSGTPFRREIPLIVALLFLVHPLQTQAVTYIVQRFTSLAALFSFISILSYLEFRTSKTKSYFYLILSFIACLLAFKTKENTATLPFIIIAIEFILFRELKITKEKILYVLPFFLLFAVIPLSFINVNQPLGDLVGELTKVSSETQNITRSQYLFTEFRVIMTYLRLLILPVHQSIDYYFPLTQSFFDAKTFFSFLFLSAIIAFAIIILKKYPVISFGILWFFIFLAVESSIIPIRDVIFEHRLYLPSIGFFLAVAYALFLAEERLKLKRILSAIFTIIIIALAIATYARNQLWNDEVALWKDAAAKFPQNSRAIGNLGIMFADQKKCTEAIPYLKKATEMVPHNANNWYVLAACHQEIGLADDAIQEFKKVLEINPKSQKASFHLADIYLARREFDIAYSVLMKSKEYFPDHPQTNALLANIRCEKDDINTALSLFNDAVKAGLNLASPYFNFAICLLNHGIIQESQKYFFKALELNPNDEDTPFFIAVTYDNQKDFQKAAYFYKQFLLKAVKSSWIPKARARLQQLGTN